MRPTRLAIVLLTVLAPMDCVTVRSQPATYGTVRVAFGTPLDSADPFLPDQIIVLRKELVALGMLGPAFVETSEGDADLVLRPFDSKLASGTNTPCGAGAARYHLGADYAELDLTCLSGDDEIAQGGGHEAGHFLGMGHLCAPHEVNPTCRPGVALDYAMMNPRVGYSTEDIPEVQGGDSFAVDIATPVPTYLDQAEFLRVWHGRTSYAISDHAERARRMARYVRPARRGPGK